MYSISFRWTRAGNEALRRGGDGMKFFHEKLSRGPSQSESYPYPPCSQDRLFLLGSSVQLDHFVVRVLGRGVSPTRKRLFVNGTGEGDKRVGGVLG